MLTLSLVRKMPQDLARVQAEGLDTEIVTTEQIAGFFRGRCAHLEAEMYDFPSSWGAVATQSMASLPIEGSLPEIKAWTEDSAWPQNRYEWFDVEEVPCGGCLARISATGTLWFFYRRMNGDWEAYASPNFA